MADPKQKLNPRQIAEAGLADWGQLMGRIRARFRTGDFTTGLAMVNHIGTLAEAANHHPDVTLTYPEVLVSLSSHDVSGITSRDVDLARQISAYATEHAITADTAGLTQLDLGLDTTAGEALAPFYAALLGSEVKDGEPVDPSGQTPTVWWQGPGEEGPPLPPADHEQRWHFDVWVPLAHGQQRVDAALAAGGTLVSDAAAPSYWVLADADGNRACVCTVAHRD